MAFYCSTCEYIFSSPRHNCPYCGGRSFSDDQSDNDLIAEGYSYAPDVQRTGETTQPPQGMSDFYQQLQTGYQSQQGGQAVAASAVSQTNTIETPPSRIGPTPFVSQQHNPEPPAFSVSPPPVIPEIQTGDYFEQFQQNGGGTVTVPEEVNVGGQDLELTRELEEHAEAARRARRQARRARLVSFWDRFITGRSFRWLIIAIAVIATISFLWQERFAMAGALEELVTELAPTVITILILVWIFRSLIRGR